MDHGSLFDQLKARFPTKGRYRERGVEAACTRKIVFSSEEAALAYVARKHDTTGNSAYQCWNCGHWHTGHDDRRRERAAGIIPTLQ